MKKAWLRLIDLARKLKERWPKVGSKRSLAFTFLGLLFFIAGAASFLLLGALGDNMILSIVLGLCCIIAAIVFVNKGDPSKLPQPHCWACGRTLEAPAEKKES